MAKMLSMPEAFERATDAATHDYVLAMVAARDQRREARNLVGWWTPEDNGSCHA